MGLLEQHCAHRGASLFFGRNEECGLRCVYHGWKFDVEGNCVDMPSEPAESGFKQRVRLTAYPTRQRAGIIWAYMGSKDRMGEPPDLEWARVPESHVVVTKYIASCNYLQALEGDIDSAHVSFLHSRLEGNRTPGRGAGPAHPNTAFSRSDRAPRFTVKDTDYGLMIGAQRSGGEDRYYWRISQWLMPVFDMIRHDPGVAMSGHALVPMDDDHVWFWALRWEGDRPMTEEERSHWRGEQARVPVVPEGFWPRASKDNDYLIDRDCQRTLSFTGIPGIGEQDLAVTESMGSIMDRTREHLGTTDLAIIRTRQKLLQAARDLQNGIVPYAAQHPEAYRVRPTAAVLKRDVAFSEDEAVRSAMRARA